MPLVGDILLVFDVCCYGVEQSEDNIWTNERTVYGPMRGQYLDQWERRTLPEGGGGVVVLPERGPGRLRCPGDDAGEVDDAAGVDKHVGSSQDPHLRLWDS